jgi:hypothetical protein
MIKKCIIVICIVFSFVSCKIHKNVIEGTGDLKLHLILIPEIDAKGVGAKYSTFKYEITNQTEHAILFNSLSISEYVIDTAGNKVLPGFFILKVTKLKPASDNLPCADPYGVVWSIPQLNKNDTLDHLFTIKSGDTKSFILKMYACFDAPPNKEAVLNYYVKKYPLEKSIQFQLIYDNTSLKSDLIYGKKIWVGRLESNIVDF